MNLYTLAGSPLTAGTYTFTINSGVTVGSTSTASAALSTGVWPTGSTVTLINNGNIYGRGGDGGAGGTYSGANATAGGTGGPALSLNYDLTIDNTNGKIYGGGGGGGGGQGVATSNSGAGGGGSFPGGPGGDGTAASPGAGVGSNQYGGMTLYYAGDGGVWASAGGTGYAGGVGGTGGTGGGAIQLNGKTVTWLGGNDVTHVKGAVQ